jgi:DNA repair exonuclease SbcCD ATPase subunit
MERRITLNDNTVKRKMEIIVLENVSLCNAANDRFFQLTRQKLSLEITPDNNFQVHDFMNGGKIRSVKTLSGGQTFQAALSLALADNIQKIDVHLRMENDAEKGSVIHSIWRE